MSTARTTSLLGSFTAQGQVSNSFTPVSLNGIAAPFNVTSRGSFVAGFQLERSFDGGTNWHAITAAGTQLYAWTAPCSEQAAETEDSVLYRLNCTSWTSGTIFYRISQ